MAATNRTELLSVTEKEFGKLLALIEPISPEAALVKDADCTSIKDVIAHRAHWIDLFLGWYGDGLAGRQVFFPAKGYKWNELKRYNAMLRKRQAGVHWQGAMDLLHGGHVKLLTFLNETPDVDLYGRPMKGARNAWTPGRWAEAAGASHYRSAAKYIRARLRVMA